MGYRNIFPRISISSPSNNKSITLGICKSTTRTVWTSDKHSYSSCHHHHAALNVVICVALQVAGPPRSQPPDAGQHDTCHFAAGDPVWVGSQIHPTRLAVWLGNLVIKRFLLPPDECPYLERRSWIVFWFGDNIMTH